MGTLTRILGTCSAAAFSLSLALPGVAQAFPRSVFDNLDYGLYWYGNDTLTQKATSPINVYYASHKPTMIYVHGWQSGKTQQLKRETFDRSGDTGIAQDLTNAWRNSGWNVGIFYWNQFADEGDVKDAEAKLWSVNGPKQMRWRKADGSYSPAPEQKTVAELFLDSYKLAMSSYNGNDVRLVGHSLGSQAVIASAKLISDAVDRGELPANARPKRVVLLDPAWIDGARPYLNNRQHIEVSNDAVTALIAKGVLFETLVTSGVVTPAAAPVINKTALRELKPWYFGAIDLIGKHNAAVWHYLWEMQFVPAKITDNTQAPGAATPNARIQVLMNNTKKVQHDNGAWTKSPGDDNYKWANK